MPSAPLDKMHDATLISIQFDWESGGQRPSTFIKR
jgi:hypothetical protein